jgi:hypothetical protein
MSDQIFDVIQLVLVVSVMEFGKVGGHGISFNVIQMTALYIRNAGYLQTPTSFET